MQRYDIINHLIKKNEYTSYLEIGVRNHNDCFNRIDCKLKHGVDPGNEWGEPATYVMTSDEFFDKHISQKYDIIFIDGLHLDYQVYRDIENSIKNLNEGGTIILHDCNPPDIYHAREDYYDTTTPAGGNWNGTVWKAIVAFRSSVHAKEYKCFVVDTDYGIGVIHKGDSTPIVNTNGFYSFNMLKENREYYLGLISVDEFLREYSIENYNDLPSLTWLAKFDDHASMGILSQRLIEKITARNVICRNIIGPLETNNEVIFSALKKYDTKELGIMFSYPDGYEQLNSYRYKVIYTGVDTSGGIANFADNCNKVDALLTPSHYSKQRMIDLGVKKPIHVLPHGIDPEKFKFSERKIGDKFKFLYVGEASDRKGIYHLLNAFMENFKDNLNVELHIKSNTAMTFYGGDVLKTFIDGTPNIFWHLSNEGHDIVSKLYEECHVYVYPSRADTFGMTLIEAMACGLPVISTPEPGATELIKGKYCEIPTIQIDVKNHPWMLGTWGEPNFDVLVNQMKHHYENYNQIISSGKLKEYSDYIREFYSWDKIAEYFEIKILPQLKKKPKVLTMLTSYNRPNHIGNVINSLKQMSDNIDNTIYIVENSNPENKQEILEIINENIDERFIVYDSEFNLGQRGALLQMLEDVNIDDYEFIQFTDQDNIFAEQIDVYTNILYDYPNYYIATGYMSKEHKELANKKTKYGNLVEKRSCRAGHMVMRVSDLKSLLPIQLDSQYDQPHNSSWNAGLDWELQYWNKKSPGFNREDNFIICVPGGVLHKGIDSTIYDWPVEENEYSYEELIEIRN